MSVNVQEEMNNAINILHDNNKQLSDYDMAFDIIDEYVDKIDYANGINVLFYFYKVRIKHINLIVF